METGNELRIPLSLGMKFGYDIGQAVRGAFQRGSTREAIIAMLKYMATAVENGTVNEAMAHTAMVSHTDKILDLKEIAAAALTVARDAEPVAGSVLVVVTKPNMHALQHTLNLPLT